MYFRYLKIIFDNGNSLINEEITFKIIIFWPTLIHLLQVLYASVVSFINDRKIKNQETNFKF